MKKFWLLGTLCCVLYAVAEAQIPIRFGVKAGLGLSTMSFQSEMVSEAMPIGDYVVHSDNNNLAPAAHLNGFAEWDFHRFLGVGAGLGLALRGYTVPSNQKEELDGFTSTMYYAHIPLYIQLRASGFFLNLGPYVALGLAGRTERRYANETPMPHPISWGQENSDSFARLDAGARMEAGGSYRNIRFFGGVDWGMVNTVPEAYFSQYGPMTAYNRAFYLGMGYVFSAR